MEEYLILTQTENTSMCLTVHLIQRTSCCVFYSFLASKTSGCPKEMGITLDFLKYWQSGQQDLLMARSDRHSKYLSWSLVFSKSEWGGTQMLLRPREVTRDVSLVGVRHMLWGPHLH